MWNYYGGGRPMGKERIMASQEGMGHEYRRVEEVVESANAIGNITFDCPSDERGRCILCGVLDVQRGKRSIAEVCRKLRIDAVEFGYHNRAVEERVRRFLAGKELLLAFDELACDLNCLQDRLRGSWHGKLLNVLGQWMDSALGVTEIRREESWWFTLIETPMRAE